MAGTLRIVADTNSDISGLLWFGAPSRLVDAALDGKVRFVTSIALLAELDDVLRRPKFEKQLVKRGLEVADVFDGYVALSELVEAGPIVPVIIADPDDDHVLAAALAGKVDAIISGDAHLLDVGSYQSIPIMRVTQFLTKLAT